MAFVLTAAPLLAQPRLALAQPADTLIILRTIDADNYDPVRSTARSAGEVDEMLTDTLTSVDWDMKTIKPGLAKSWTVSPDGKLYTFKLRDDVTFCDGRKMTADDVVYSLNRLADPATHSPVRWRAGQMKEIRAVDPTTVEYELNQPSSELLFQLSLFFAGIVDKHSVETLGANFGVQGFNGTGPFCWSSWTPRSDMVLTKHEGYNWGPPIFKNPSPQVDKIIWRVIPDDNTRLAALQSGQGDLTQYIPYFALDGLKKMPGLHVQPAQLLLGLLPRLQGQQAGGQRAGSAARHGDGDQPPRHRQGGVLRRRRCRRQLPQPGNTGLRSEIQGTAAEVRPGGSAQAAR
jgi:peptide/nickel transport system substrate-binding protein